MNDVRDNRRDIHWLSGALLIAVDLAFFGANAMVFMGTAGLSTPLNLLICLIAFVVTGIGVFLVQKFTDEEDTGSALAKGFALGVIAGVPTPIAGTIVGSVVIRRARLRDRN